MRITPRILAAAAVAASLGSWDRPSMAQGLFGGGMVPPDGYYITNGNAGGGMQGLNRNRMMRQQQRARNERMRMQNDPDDGDQTVYYPQQPQYVQQQPQQPQLVPHPQYPGYYYDPSNPGQLYYYPSQTPPQATAPAPAQTQAVAQPQPQPQPAQANATATNVLPPSRVVSVTIVNPDKYGTPINFAVDGTPYSVPSGYAQKLTVTASSVITFNRGGEFGDARYSLQDGGYEFAVTDKGWELHKKDQPSPVSVSATAGNAPPTNPTTAVAPALYQAPAPTTAAPVNNPTPIQPPAPIAAPATNSR